MIGRSVEVRSVAGILYSGIVRSIRPDEGLGEVFELGKIDNPEYQRFVHVVDPRLGARQR